MKKTWLVFNVLVASLYLLLCWWWFVDVGLRFSRQSNPHPRTRIPLQHSGAIRRTSSFAPRNAFCPFVNVRLWTIWGLSLLIQRWLRNRTKIKENKLISIVWIKWIHIDNHLNGSINCHGVVYKRPFIGWTCLRIVLRNFTLAICKNPQRRWISKRIKVKCITHECAKYE